MDTENVYEISASINVVRSIARETGITISGILSLSQMAMLGATIDTEKKQLIINN